MSVLSIYQPYFRGWKSGKRPTTREFKLVHDMHLARPGTKTAFAVAMALLPNGTSQPQIMQILSSPHRNKIKELALRKDMKLTREKDGNVVRIKLTPRAV